MMGFKEFREDILKINSKDKKFKVSNSIGVYDMYKSIRKHGWYDIGRPVKEKEFYAIIRGVNDLLADEIARGNTVIFPSRMGRLELRKLANGARIVNGKLKIDYPIDWESTLRLWFEDSEARQEKTLIRRKDEFRYRVKYCKHDANYNNKSFYEFTLNRDIKRALKENILKGRTDTLW